jgi:hypothetical protein
MTTTRQSPSEEDLRKSKFPLFLIALPTIEKSQDIFKVTGFSHIYIRVEGYKNQNGLTQCYNWQKIWLYLGKL